MNGIDPEIKLKNRRQTSLETANQMYKDAFLIIKTRMARAHPTLAEAELQKLTASYFINLNSNSADPEKRTSP